MASGPGVRSRARESSFWVVCFGQCTTNLVLFLIRPHLRPLFEVPGKQGSSSAAPFCALPKFQPFEVRMVRALERLPSIADGTRSSFGIILEHFLCILLVTQYLEGLQSDRNHLKEIKCPPEATIRSTAISDHGNNDGHDVHGDWSRVDGEGSKMACATYLVSIDRLGPHTD